jgi:long-chain fatty acid transport protein
MSPSTHKAAAAMVGILAVLFIGAPRIAWGGGFFLYELGTPDLGLAAAGQAARAQDASTVFTNPAGMTMLDKSQALFGMQGYYGRLDYKPDANTTTTGTDGGNALVHIPAASAFYVHRLSPKLRLGIGAFSYFGGAIEYNLNWVGRYYLQGITMLGFSIMPAIAYQVNDWLSVGGGLNIMLGALRQKVGINNLIPGMPDGKMRFEDYTVGVGGNIGIMLTPQEGTRIGISYLTPVSLDFKDVPHYTGLGPVLSKVLQNGASLSLGMTVPQAVMVSLFHQASDRLALMGNIGWQNWEQFGQLAVSVDSANPKSLTADLKYQDTAHIAVGAQYLLDPKWLLSGGFAYDSSMVNNENRTTLTPVGDQYRFGLGAQWFRSKKVVIGFADELQLQGDLPMTQAGGPVRGTVSGKFSDVFIDFFSVNVTWRPGGSS